MVTGVMENLVENSNDSRSTKSRNAKVSETGRNLEDSSSWQPGGITTKPPLCKSLDEVGRSLEGQHAGNSKQRPSCVKPLGVKTQPRTLRRLGAFASVGEWEEPQERGKSAHQVQCDPKEDAESKGREADCRRTQKGLETGVERQSRGELICSHRS